ncbi:MAG: alpha/beta hydrolase [Ignavibacteria bacterium]|nr:alpha/beta hydrolase [Ignavibacteria bacterium]
MKTVKVEFLNHDGLKLSGSIDMPVHPHEDGPFATFAHCFTCSKELKAIQNISLPLTRRGISVLRFDMSGIGESEGSFPETNFTTQISDFLSAAEFLEKEYKSPALLMGHSLGGCVALYAASKLPGTKAIVTIASPEEPANLAVKLKRTKQRAIKYGVAEAEIGGVKFNFKPQFFSDIETYNLKAAQKSIHIPYLAMHSVADTYSDFENAEILFEHANQPKSLISLDDIDHLMLDKEDAAYVGELIAVWSKKYI